MNKLIRVVLSLVSDQFSSGIQSAISSLSGFGNIVSGLRDGFLMLKGAATAVWDTFIKGAIDEERLIRQMGILAGSSEKGAALVERLDKWIVQTGVDGADAEAAFSDLAVGIKAATGELDPDQLFKYMEIIESLALATGKTASDLARPVMRAITGDVEQLARALGINKERLAQLSPEFAKMMDSATQAGEAQLGAVTRLAGRSEQVAGDALKALEEITAGLTGGQDVLSDFGDSTEAELNRAKQNWDDFTELVGEQFLPIITDALREINKWIEEHPEEIKQFIEAFGNFSATQWERFADALSRVDWEKIADVMLLMVEVLDKMTNAEWKLPGEDLYGLSAGQLGAMAATEGKALESQYNGQLGDVSTAAQLGGLGNSAAMKAGWQLGGWIASNIKITFGIDEEGQLNVKKIAEDKATDAIGAVIENMTEQHSKKGMR
jgi:hypothetical protein